MIVTILTSLFGERKRCETHDGYDGRSDEGNLTLFMIILSYSAVVERIHSSGSMELI